MAARLTELDDARAMVLDCARPLGTEEVVLAEALGRVLASEITATHPVPPFKSSAMDGFAVRSSDVSDAESRSPVRLALVAESRAGHPAAGSLAAGEAIAVSTGAVVPDGADAVIRLEDASSENGFVEVLAGVGPETYVRPIGSDVREGETVVARGARLGPAALGVLASVGAQRLVCFRRPTVSVLSTGDELAALGEPLRAGMVNDSNSHSLPALVRRAGAEVLGVGHVRDDPAATTDAISAALSADVVVVCGGVSVGSHDYVRASLAELGAGERFFGVALKPGKPTWFGTQGKTLVFALPGNPVSAMVTFILFVRPALWALGGAPVHSARAIGTLAADYAKEPGRAHALRCRLRFTESGWEAEPTGPQDSHILTSMLAADALAIIPAASGPVAAGERVQIELLEPALAERAIPA